MLSKMDDTSQKVRSLTSSRLRSFVKPIASSKQPNPKHASHAICKVFAVFVSIHCLVIVILVLCDSVRTVDTIKHALPQNETS